VSWPRKPVPSGRSPSPKKGPRATPEDLARDAIAHEDATPEGKVKMTFRVVLARQCAEAPRARALREEKNLERLVTEPRGGDEERPDMRKRGAPMNRRAFLSALSGSPSPRRSPPRRDRWGRHRASVFC
jgi:hypothetical protein